MPGQIGWIDLTVPNAEALRDFYQGVTGWTPAPVDMGRFCVIEDPAGAVSGLFESRKE
jgi:predicted enzyme related to lactoylglutathione lyase